MADFFSSWIGSWVSCREANQPGRGINAAKRFDITSLPAHPSALSAKIRPKPFKDKRRRKHKHSKPKTYGHQSAKEGPKIDVELKLNDEPKAEAQDEVPVVQPQGVLGQPVHHRPWLPYMHRPLHPFNMRYHPHFFPHYMHHNMRFQHPSYWRFQGYFPHFMRMRAPWGITPSDMTNIHRYPEYQFGDVQFVQPNHPFRYSRPPFRDVNDFSSDVKLLDRPEKLHEHLMHSKNKIKNHNEYNGLHEEDRKMVNDSEDSKEPFKWDKYKQRGAEHEKEPNTGIREEQDVLHFNPTEKEDEETNYPEYKSEFNTNRLWPSVEKRQGKVYNHFRFHKPEKEESAIFREFTPANLGFDLDDISTSHSKRKQQSKEGQKTDGVGHKVSSGVGVVKIKSDSAVIVNAIKAFA